MSLAFSIFTFIVALPCAVWFLGSLISIFDSPIRTTAMLRATLGVVAILALAVFVHTHLLVLFSMAFIFVSIAHIGWFFFARRFLIGVPRYEPAPITVQADLPELDDDDFVDDERQDDELQYESDDEHEDTGQTK